MRWVSEFLVRLSSMTQEKGIPEWIKLFIGSKLRDWINWTTISDLFFFFFRCHFNLLHVCNSFIFDASWFSRFSRKSSSRVEIFVCIFSPAKGWNFSEYFIAVVFYGAIVMTHEFWNLPKKHDIILRCKFSLISCWTFFVLFGLSLVCWFILLQRN